MSEFQVPEIYSPEKDSPETIKQSPENYKFVREDSLSVLDIPIAKKWYKSKVAQILLKVIIGSSLLAIPAVIDYILNIKNNPKALEFIYLRDYESPWTLAEYSLFCWSIFFSIIWAELFAIIYLSTILPDLINRIAELFIGKTPKILHKWTGMLKSLKKNLVLFFYFMALLVTFSQTFTSQKQTNLFDFSSDSSKVNIVWQSYIIKLILCLYFFSICWLIQKILLHLFAFNFHKNTFQERQDYNNDAIKTISCLNQARTMPKVFKSSSFLAAESIEVLRDHSDTQKKSHNAFNFAYEIGHRAAMVVGTAVGVDFAADTQNIHKYTIESVKNKRDARIFATSLYKNIVQLRNENEAHHSHSELFLFDFEKFFTSIHDAKYAFGIFDQNSNGMISKSEFKGTIQEIFDEKFVLDKSMVNSTQSIGKLDTALFVLVLIISIFASLGIWSVNVDSILTSLAAIWIGLAFAVGDTLTKLFSNIIFVFFTHPFDCGDNIEFKNELYTVKEFHLMHTVLESERGKMVYAPNYVLSQEILVNNRRSAPLREQLSITCKYQTVTRDSIAHLQEFLDEFVHKNSQDFIPNERSNTDASTKNQIQWKKGVKNIQSMEPYGVWIYLDEIVNAERLVLYNLRINLSVVYYHKHNANHEYRCKIRRTKFSSALIKGLNQCKIELWDPSETSVKMNKT